VEIPAADSPAPETLLRRALLALRSGEAERAEEDFEHVLALVPDQPLALHYGGLCAHRLGRRDEALRRLRRSLALAPREGAFWANAGFVFHDLGLEEEACGVLLRASELDPENVAVHARLGPLLFARGYHALAEAPLRKSLEARPEDARLWELLARTRLERGRHAEAEKTLRKALAHHPGEPSLWMALGETLLTLDRHDEAREAFLEAGRLAPKSDLPTLGLAGVLTDQGRFEEARTTIRSLLAANPDSAAAWSALLGIVRVGGPDDPDLVGARACLARQPELAERPAASSFFFALGKACEEAGLYAEAFRHYTTGNRASGPDTGYRPAFQARFARALLLATGADFRRRHTPQEPPPPFTPVYIVGMPRSGTTLMEQMLAAHPALSPGGEMSSFHEILSASLGVGTKWELPEALARADAEAIVALRRASTDLLARTARGKPFVTDKMPANYLFLGLLRTLFPHLRILHMRRDPRDTCLSCYTTNFRFGHEFASNLTDLGTHYRCYETVVGFWREALPPSLFLDVDYETLVAEPEPTLRRVLAFLGLPWDPAVLAFHEVVRPVRTASVYQVRQPLNRRSVGRWRRFAPWLGPLDEALGLRTPLPPPFTLPEGTRL
jgi:Flp pilus assembly protein TadD